MDVTANLPLPALILRRSEIAALMDRADYLAAVEAAFRCLASGAAKVPLPMHIPVENGGFHAKGACVVLDRAFVAVKVNGNFPGNPMRTGLPTIQGAILLCDGSDGTLLAVMDSIEITLRRTAAATALAARYLAREDASSVAVCGCGEQGRAQLAALADVAPLKRAFAWDIDAEKARRFAEDMERALRFEVTAVRRVEEATRGSDIVVTATSSRMPFLTKACVSAGTFIAAVGADSPDKSELDGELLAASKIVVDSLAQCAVMGDLHHAIESGRVRSTDIHAELGDLVSQRKDGRTASEEITVFDSTGLAIEDAASAARVYQRALAANVGIRLALGAA